MISDQGLPLLGTGSEWFWTALSTLIVLVSLVAIYRQVRAQTAANATGQMFAFEAELDSERLLRHKLALVQALLDDVDPVDLPEASAFALCSFFERVGFLTRREHFDHRLLWVSRPYADWWWRAMATWVARRRDEENDPTLFAHFEWLAEQLRQPVGDGSGLSAWEGDERRASLERRRTWYQDQIDVAVAIRT